VSGRPLDVIRALALPVFLLVGAEITAAVVGMNSYTLAPPSVILVAGARAFADGSLLLETLQTSVSVLAGFALGGIIGVFLGLLFGLHRRLDHLTELPVEVVRAIPSIALLPVWMVIYGLGYKMEIAVIAFTTIWPNMVMTPRLLEVSHLLGLSFAQQVWKIVLPATLPGIFVALRLTLGFSLIIGYYDRDRRQSAGAWRRHHGGSRRDEPRLDAGFSDLDWAHWQPSEHSDELGAEPALRPGHSAEVSSRGEEVSKSRFGWYMGSLFVGAALVLVWKVVVDARMISPVFVPSPVEAFRSLIDGLLEGDAAELFLATLMRMVCGWFLASVVGIVLGAVIGSSRTAQAYLGPTLEALRPLPASAIIPVAIAFLGLSERTVLTVVAFGALWPMLLSTTHGFRYVEPRLFEVARLFRMSTFQFAWKIALPSAMPEILAGARLSLTASLAMAVAGEMLVGVDGVGQWMLSAGRSYRSADVFAGLIMLAIIGISSSMVLDLIDRGLLGWRRFQN
jgi:sulfonate transport system permease protein